jgi:hypothetical protein
MTLLCQESLEQTRSLSPAFRVGSSSRIEIIKPVEEAKMRIYLALVVLSLVLVLQVTPIIALSQEMPSVIDHTMAIDVDEESYQPIGVTYSFSVDDEVAISWINFGPVDRSHEVLWEWYSPDNELYSTWSEMLEDPGKDYYWEEYPIWDWMDIAGYEASQMPGEWRVDIYLDEILITTENFTILPAPTEEQMAILPSRAATANLFVVVTAGASISDEYLDGFIGLEWADSLFLEIELVTEDGRLRFPGALYLKHDGTQMYMGIRIDPEVPVADIEVFVATDVNNSKVLYDRGDDLLDLWVAASKGKLISDGVDFAYTADFSFVPDSDVGGVEDARAAATFSNGMLSVEFVRPLASGDRLGNDPQLEPGDEVLMSIGFTAAGSKRFEATLEFTAKTPPGKWEIEWAAAAGPRVAFAEDWVGEGKDAKKLPVIRLTSGFPGFPGFGTETYVPDDFKPSPGGATTTVGGIKGNLYQDSNNHIGVDLDGDGEIDVVNYEGKWVCVSKPTVERIKAAVKITRGKTPTVSIIAGKIPAGSIVTLRDSEGQELILKVRSDGSFPPTNCSCFELGPDSTITVIVQHVTGAKLMVRQKEIGGGSVLRIQGPQYECKVK